MRHIDLLTRQTRFRYDAVALVALALALACTVAAEPLLTLQYPNGGTDATVYQDTVCLGGRAEDTAAVLQIFWTNLTTGVGGSVPGGSTNCFWLVPVTLVPGSQVYEIWAQGMGGISSATQSVGVTYNTGTPPDMDQYATGAVFATNLKVSGRPAPTQLLDTQPVFSWEFGDGLNVGSMTNMTMFDLGSPFGDFTRAVAVSDLTGDGLPDVVVGNYQQQSYVLVNDGSGNPTNFPRVNLGVGGTYSTFSVAIGDLTGDSLPDVAAGAYNAGGPWGEQNYVVLNNGSGNPTTFTRVNLSSGPGDKTFDIAIGDVTGDNRNDVVAGNLDQNFVLANDASGTPPTFPRYNLGSATNDATYTVSIGDLTGDGRNDVVVGNSGQQSYVIVADLLGTPSNYARVTLGSATNMQTNSSAVGDLTGDGLPDVAVGNSPNRQSHVLANNGSGDPTTFPRHNLGSVQNNSTVAIAIGDVTGDGVPDVVTGNGNQQNYVLAGNRSGDPSTFTRMALGSALNDSTYAVAIGDLTGDGRLDVVVGNNGQNYVLANTAITMPYSQLGYQIQVASQSNDWVGSIQWDSGVASASSMGDGMATIRAPLSFGRGTYYWRVRLFSPSTCQSPWSAAQRFDIVGPFIRVTTTPFAVSYVTTNCTIAGTVDRGIVGTMRWTNLLNDSYGTVAASTWWQIDGIPLGPRENTIVVYGTNTAGLASSDSIVVTRGLSTEMYLLSPPDGYVTNVFSLLLDVLYPSAMPSDRRYISTNAGVSWFAYIDTVTFEEEGNYQWTAMGYDDLWNQIFAPSTNRLRISAVPPKIALLSPENGEERINQFAIDLLADYSFGTVGRQLSTNGGTTWFDYQPGMPVYFPSTGTWHWTARGRLVEWGYAPATNRLTISASGRTPALHLLEPAQGLCTTNQAVRISVCTVPASGAFVFIRLSTNNGATHFSFDFPSNVFLTPGTYRWSALGYYGVPAPTSNRWAMTTNMFQVLAANAAAVRLSAPEHNGARLAGYVSFDVQYMNVGRRQLSTNNGAGWFTYASPVLMPAPQTIMWTARGTNAAGIWVYAPSTNRLSLAGPREIDITNVPFTVDLPYLFAPAGTSSPAIVGAMWVSNGNSGQRVFFPADTSWTAPSVTLVLASNVIWVGGTNTAGAVSQDTLVIIGIPEGMAALCAALATCAMAWRRTAWRKRGHTA